MHMKIFNRTRNRIVVKNARMAKTFWQRGLGLWAFPRLNPGTGLLLVPCRWIHTLGMAYAIDALYLDQQGYVIQCETLHPWRIGSRVQRAQAVLELAAGTFAQNQGRIGDQLVWEEA
jgi:uncharacterized membrane protein (UPF0127 family)